MDTVSINKLSSEISLQPIKIQNSNDLVTPRLSWRVHGRIAEQLHFLITTFVNVATKNQKPMGSNCHSPLKRKKIERLCYFQQS